MTDEMITITEYARQHGISPATMRQRIARGRHPEAVKIGRDWLIPRGAALVDKRTEGSDRWNKEERKMKMIENNMELVAVNEAYLTEDSFGAELPENWQELAAWHAEKVDALQHYDHDGAEDDDGEYVSKEDLDDLWGEVCSK